MTGLTMPFPQPPAFGEAVEVAEGVLWAQLPLPMVLNHVNVFALDDGDSWTLVDTGLIWQKCRAALQALIDGPLAGKPIARVLVTHHHPDHIGNAGWLQDQGAELVTTRTAWLFARMLTLDVQEVSTPESVDFYRSAGMRPDLLKARETDRPFNFADAVHPMPLGFTRIKEGDRFRAAGRDWVVRIGNGHAPEHATLWADGLVIGGDQLLATISPNLGVYATEPLADPVADWLEACERLQPFAREDQLVLPGHKLPFTGLPFRMVQLIENHHSALARLLDHLSTPKTAVECFPPLFKRTIGDGEYGLALVEAVAHLNHLLHLGQVTRERRSDGAWLWTRTP
jgi:glyoxylase-like metal-dependent hydrolase (beta-lactamase superfamily II)